MAASPPRPTPPPEAVDRYSSRVGLEAIAVFEAIKGAAVLAAGFGLLALVHRDLPDIVENLIHHLHMNPEGHLSHVFLHAAEGTSDARLHAIAGAAFAYSLVRFVEAYGLWNARVWAEWFAILSGMMYLPWEIYEIVMHPRPIRWVIFIGNIVILLYLIYARIRAIRIGRQQMRAGLM
jgi:uncharacterized membrane protein (DUF2068 family)